MWALHCFETNYCNTRYVVPKEEHQKMISYTEPLMKIANMILSALMKVTQSSQRPLHFAIKSLYVFVCRCAWLNG